MSSPVGEWDQDNATAGHDHGGVTPATDDDPPPAGGSQPAPGQDTPVDGNTVDEAPTLYYGSVDQFVREYLIYVYRRRISGRGQGRVWAAQWWRYEEAVIRLEALWRAWEHLRLDPTTGMSVWWRDHADHHMAMLLDPDGPFAGVDGEQNANQRGEPLPYQPPPPGLFPDVRAPHPAA
jgi:hypothetical protein